MIDVLLIPSWQYLFHNHETEEDGADNDHFLHPELLYQCWRHKAARHGKQIQHRLSGKTQRRKVLGENLAHGILRNICGNIDKKENCT